MGGRHGLVDVTALCRGEEPTGCGRREPAVLGGKQRAGGGGEDAAACSRARTRTQRMLMERGRCTGRQRARLVEAGKHVAVSRWQRWWQRLGFTLEPARAVRGEREPQHERRRRLWRRRLTAGGGGRSSRLEQGAYSHMGFACQ